MITLTRVGLSVLFCLGVFTKTSSAINFPSVDLGDKKATKDAFKELSKENKGVVIYPKFLLRTTSSGTCHVRLLANGDITVNDSVLVINLPERRFFTIDKIEFNAEKNRIDISGDFKIALYIQTGIADAGKLMDYLFYPSSHTKEQISEERSKSFREVISKWGFVAEEAPALEKIAYLNAFLNADYSLSVETVDEKRYLSYAMRAESSTAYNTIKLNKKEMIATDFEENIKEFLPPVLVDGSIPVGAFKTVEGIIVRFKVDYHNFLETSKKDIEAGTYEADLYLPFQALVDFGAKKVDPVELLKKYPLIVNGQKYVLD